MMLDFYSTEKMYEFELKEKEKVAREFWKWTSRRNEDARKKKEVNDN